MSYNKYESFNKVIHIYHGILLSNKMEQNIIVCKNKKA
jgi:hypothetical protein